MDKNVNKTDEIVEDLDIEPEESGQTDEKKFSQSEVDEIVKKRLQRQQKKFDDELDKQLDEKSAVLQSDLAERETAVACKEFLIDNHYPVELLDIIGVTEVSEFQKKVNQLDGLLKPRQTYPYNAEPIISGGMRDDIQKAFSPDVRHKPKSWY